MKTFSSSFYAGWLLLLVLFCTSFYKCSKTRRATVETDTATTIRLGDGLQNVSDEMSGNELSPDHKYETFFDW